MNKLLVTVGLTANQGDAWTEPGNPGQCANFFLGKHPDDGFIPGCEKEKYAARAAESHHLGKKSSCPQISQIIAAARISLNMPERPSPRRRGIEASMPPQ